VPIDAERIRTLWVVGSSYRWEVNQFECRQARCGRGSTAFTALLSKRRIAKQVSSQKNRENRQQTHRRNDGNANAQRNLSKGLPDAHCPFRFVRVSVWQGSVGHWWNLDRADQPSGGVKPVSPSNDFRKAASLLQEFSKLSYSSGKTEPPATIRP